jgi:hypothetical protein
MKNPCQSGEDLIFDYGLLPMVITALANSPAGSENAAALHKDFGNFMESL